MIVNGMSSYYFYFSTLAVPDTVADIKVMSDKKMKKKRHIKCKIWKGDTCVMQYVKWEMMHNILGKTIYCSFISFACCIYTHIYLIIIIIINY